MATTTTLSARIEEGDTVIPVAALTGFNVSVRPGDCIVVNIDSESILCNAKDGNALVAAVRGYNSTTAAVHLSAATVTLSEIVAARVFSVIKLGTVYIFTGAGTPEAAVVAPIGSLFLRNDGSTSTTLYVKTATGTLNTGWTAK